MEDHHNVFLLICLHAPAFQPLRHMVDANLSVLGIKGQAIKVVCTSERCCIDSLLNASSIGAAFCMQVVDVDVEKEGEQWGSLSYQ